MIGKRRRGMVAVVEWWSGGVLVMEASSLDWWLILTPALQTGLY